MSSKLNSNQVENLPSEKLDIYNVKKEAVEAEDKNQRNTPKASPSPKRGDTSISPRRSQTSPRRNTPTTTSPRQITTRQRATEEEADNSDICIEKDKIVIKINLKNLNQTSKKRKKKRKKYKKSSKDDSVSKKSKMYNNVSVNIERNLNYALGTAEQTSLSVNSHQTVGINEQTATSTNCFAICDTKNVGSIRINSGVIPRKMNKYSLRNTKHSGNDINSRLSQKILELTQERLHMNYSNSLLTTNNHLIGVRKSSQVSCTSTSQTHQMISKLQQAKDRMYNCKSIREILQHSSIDHRRQTSSNLEYLDKFNNNFTCDMNDSGISVDGFTEESLVDLTHEDAEIDNEFIDIHDLQAFIPYETYLQNLRSSGNDSIAETANSQAENPKQTPKTIPSTCTSKNQLSRRTSGPNYIRIDKNFCEIREISTDDQLKTDKQVETCSNVRVHVEKSIKTKGKDSSNADDMTEVPTSPLLRSQTKQNKGNVLTDAQKKKPSTEVTSNTDTNEISNFTLNKTSSGNLPGDSTNLESTVSSEKNTTHQTMERVKTNDTSKNEEKLENTNVPTSATSVSCKNLQDTSSRKIQEISSTNVQETSSCEVSSKTLLKADAQSKEVSPIKTSLRSYRKQSNQKDEANVEEIDSDQRPSSERNSGSEIPSSETSSAVQESLKNTNNVHGNRKGEDGQSQITACEDEIDRIAPIKLSQVMKNIQLEVDLRNKELLLDNLLNTCSKYEQDNPSTNVSHEQRISLMKTSLKENTSNSSISNSNDQINAKTSCENNKIGDSSENAIKRLMKSSNISVQLVPSQKICPKSNLALEIKSGNTSQDLKDKVENEQQSSNDSACQETLFEALNLFKDRNHLAHSKIRNQNEINKLLLEIDKGAEKEKLEFVKQGVEKTNDVISDTQDLREDTKQTEADDESSREMLFEALHIFKDGNNIPNRKVRKQNEIDDILLDFARLDSNEQKEQTKTKLETVVSKCLAGLECGELSEISSAEGNSKVPDIPMKISNSDLKAPNVTDKTRALEEIISKLDYDTNMPTVLETRKSDRIQKLKTKLTLSEVDVSTNEATAETKTLTNEDSMIVKLTANEGTSKAEKSTNIATSEAKMLSKETSSSSRDDDNTEEVGRANIVPKTFSTSSHDNVPTKLVDIDSQENPKDDTISSLQNDSSSTSKEQEKDEKEDENSNVVETNLIAKKKYLRPRKCKATKDEKEDNEAAISVQDKKNVIDKVENGDGKQSENIKGKKRKRSSEEENGGSNESVQENDADKIEKVNDKDVCDTNDIKSKRVKLLCEGGTSDDDDDDNIKQNDKILKSNKAKLRSQEVKDNTNLKTVHNINSTDSNQEKKSEEKKIQFQKRKLRSVSQNENNVQKCTDENLIESIDMKPVIIESEKQLKRSLRSSKEKDVHTQDETQVKNDEIKEGETKNTNIITRSVQVAETNNDQMKETDEQENTNTLKSNQEKRTVETKNSSENANGIKARRQSEKTRISEPKEIEAILRKLRRSPRGIGTNNNTTKKSKIVKLLEKKTKGGTKTKSKSQKFEDGVDESVAKIHENYINEAVLISNMFTVVVPPMERMRKNILRSSHKTVSSSPIEQNKNVSIKSNIPNIETNLENSTISNSFDESKEFVGINKNSLRQSVRQSVDSNIEMKKKKRGRPKKRDFSRYMDSTDVVDERTISGEVKTNRISKRGRKKKIPEDTESQQEESATIEPNNNDISHANKVGGKDDGTVTKTKNMKQTNKSNAQLKEEIKKKYRKSRLKKEIPVEEVQSDTKRKKNDLTQLTRNSKVSLKKSKENLTTINKKYSDRYVAKKNISRHYLLRKSVRIQRRYSLRHQEKNNFSKKKDKVMKNIGKLKGNKKHEKNKKKTDSPIKIEKKEKLKKKKSFRSVLVTNETSTPVVNIKKEKEDSKIIKQEQTMTEIHNSITMQILKKKRDKTKSHEQIISKEKNAKKIKSKRGRKSKVVNENVKLKIESLDETVNATQSDVYEFQDDLETDIPIANKQCFDTQQSVRNQDINTNAKGNENSADDTSNKKQDIEKVKRGRKPKVVNESLKLKLEAVETNTSETNVNIEDLYETVPQLKKVWKIEPGLADSLKKEDTLQSVCSSNNMCTDAAGVSNGITVQPASSTISELSGIDQQIDNHVETAKPQTSKKNEDKSAKTQNKIINKGNLYKIIQNIKTELKEKQIKTEPSKSVQNSAGGASAPNVFNKVMQEYAQTKVNESGKPFLDQNKSMPCFNGRTYTELTIESCDPNAECVPNPTTVEGSEQFSAELLNSMKIKKEQLKYFESQQPVQTDVKDKKVFLQKCLLCDRLYRSAFRMREHLRKCHAGQLFECDCCNETFVDKLAYDTHMQSHDAGIDCKFCGGKYQKSNIKDHLVLHIAADHRHRISDGCFNKKQTSLLTHFLKKHGFKLQCHLCADSFCPRSNMLRHYDAKHSNERIFYSCERCNKQFSMLQNLKRHLAIHEGITYECKLCDRKYSRLGDYKIHMNIHNGVKYQCQICFKCTSRPSYLKKHMILLHQRQYSLDMPMMMQGHLMQQALVTGEANSSDTNPINVQ